MFNNRYITRGIQERVPLFLQIKLWSMIDNLQGKIELDYLQVFMLSADKDKQIIKHTREIPPYKQEISIICNEPITTKIFVIDDETHCTMLLASEY